MGSGKGEAKRISKHLSKNVLTSDFDKILDVFREVKNKNSDFEHIVLHYSCPSKEAQKSKHSFIEYYISPDSDVNNLTHDEVDYVLTEVLRDALEEKQFYTGDTHIDSIVLEKIKDLKINTEDFKIISKQLSHVYSIYQLLIKDEVVAEYDTNQIILDQSRKLFLLSVDDIDNIHKYCHPVEVVSNLFDNFLIKKKIIDRRD